MCCNLQPIQLLIDVLIVYFSQKPTEAPLRRSYIMASMVYIYIYVSQSVAVSDLNGTLKASAIVVCVCGGCSAVPRPHTQMCVFVCFVVYLAARDQ